MTNKGFCPFSSSGASAPFIHPPTRHPVAKSSASHFPVQTRLSCDAAAIYLVLMFMSSTLKSHNCTPVSSDSMDTRCSSALDQQTSLIATFEPAFRLVGLPRSHAIL